MFHLGQNFGPSLDFGSAWSYRVGLRTYKAKSDVAALAHNSRLREDITLLSSYSNLRKIGGLHGILWTFETSVCRVTVRFRSFGLTRSKIERVQTYTQPECPKPNRHSAQGSSKSQPDTMYTTKNMNTEMSDLPAIATYNARQQRRTLPCKSEVRPELTKPTQYPNSDQNFDQVNPKLYT